MLVTDLKDIQESNYLLLLSFLTCGFHVPITEERNVFVNVYKNVNEIKGGKNFHSVLLQIDLHLYDVDVFLFFFC